MNDVDFPDELRSFIQETLPTVEAVELLLLLSSQPERTFTPADVVAALRPTGVKEPAVRKCLTLLTARGVLSAQGADRFSFRPASAAVERNVRALTKAYNERPVTLIRMIYSLRDSRIRSFADAFKILKE